MQSGSKSMSHGSERLVERFCTASEGITEHTLEGNEFWVLKKGEKRKERLKYDTSRLDSISAV